jgi:hypothetical protein
MKSLKLLFTILITGSLLSSCSVVFEDAIEQQISLEEVVSGYDLWYIDYHRTTGTGEIPFLSKAFTVSFLNGNMYANNNIADIGRTGNGLGILVGGYNTFNGYLDTNHNLDGRNSFDVYEISGNEIEIYDNYNNVTYYLVGYQRNNFDYDKLFYENIEYFLQEYVAWEKTATTGGVTNAFDDENYLQFTPENTTTFYSSHDDFGTNIDIILWKFVGDYTIYDVNGYEDLKILTLNYDGGDIEEFELSVINDEKVRLYHVSSETTYDFSGRGFVQYLKAGKSSKVTVRNTDRKRTKVVREKKNRRNLK